MEPGRSEPRWVARKRIAELLALLRQVHAEHDPAPELLLRFQQRYDALDRDERPAFFESLLLEMEVEPGVVSGALQAAQAHGTETGTEWSRLMTRLRRSLESPRLAAFRRLPSSPGGFRFLLRLRAHVLEAQRQRGVDLQPLDEEIAHLLDSWFQQGFLFLQQITRDSPLRQIQFLRTHELVHPVESLEEMEVRLGEDRACFALYHKALPDEPVVFIEAALTRGLCRSIHDIIGDGAAAGRRRPSPDTAVFYSISNTQQGLAGLGLGRILVFQVVEAIRQRHPGIRTFATLSPLPGFWKRYLRPLLLGEDELFAMKKARLRDFFVLESARDTVRRRQAERSRGPAGDFESALVELLGSDDWIEDTALVKALRRPLTRLAYFYLAREKNAQGDPLNPVAGFHLGNGATLRADNVNFAANRSARGLRDSCGLMVNYVYSRTWLEQIGRGIRALLPWKS